MKKNIIVLLSVVLWAPFVHAENSVILKQKAAPLTITKYSASFEPARVVQLVLSHEKIKHAVAYKNTSGKEIVALQIGLAVFDAFNNFMDGFKAWSTDTIAVDTEGNGEWEQQPYAMFGFAKYGTGVAYVKAVRFADGTIWRADMAEVLTEMQKFENNLKKEDLEEKKK